MAQSAILGQQITWTCAGTSDTLECQTYDLTHNGGYQFDINGFNAETMTLVAHTRSGAEKTVDIADGTGESALVANGFGVSRFVISGVAAGTYPITISKANVRA
jgi:hypothetical protein